MQKTTVYLDEADLARLKALAATEGVKPAALIRKATSLLVDTGQALPRGTGAYRSNRTDTSEK